MSETNLSIVQRKISEIENAIRERNVNNGINAYNIIRQYAKNPLIDAQTRKLAHDKGLELYALLVQMRQESMQQPQMATKIPASPASSASMQKGPVPQIQQQQPAQKGQAVPIRQQAQPQQAAEEYSRILSVPQPKKNEEMKSERAEYPDPMPLKKAPGINPKAIIALLAIILLVCIGTYMAISNSGKVNCAGEGPFTCKETSLKVSAKNTAQNFVILNLDQSKGTISDFNITAVSASIAQCKEIYIDKAYLLASNYKEMKILFDCANLKILEIGGSITINYKFNGAERENTIRFGRAKDMPKNDTSPAKKNDIIIDNGEDDTNTYRPPGASTGGSNSSSKGSSGSNGTSSGGGGGGGGGSSPSIISIIDNTKPTVSISIAPTNPNSTQAVTFNATAHDNKALNRIQIYVNSTQVKNCLMESADDGTCAYTGGPYAVGNTITYYAKAYDDNENLGNSTTHSIVIGDTIAPNVSISAGEKEYPEVIDVYFNGTARDNVDISSIRYKVNDGSWHDAYYGLASGVYSWYAWLDLRNGTNIVEVEATDNSSNIARRNTTVNNSMHPKPDKTIYDDNIFCSIILEDTPLVCWEDHSYSYDYDTGYVNFTSQDVVYNGTSSLRFEGDTSDVISLESEGILQDINIDGYGGLAFYVNGTPNTTLFARLRSSYEPETFPNISIDLTGQWTHVQINMTQLNPNRFYFDNIEFVPGILPENAANTTFYLDDIKLAGLMTDNSPPTIAIDHATTMSMNTTHMDGTSITLNGSITDDTYILYNLLVYRNNHSDEDYHEGVMADWTMDTGQTFNWTQEVSLALGENIIEFMAWDESGKGDIETVNITLNLLNDTTPPTLNITFPSENANITDSFTTIIWGYVSDDTALSQIRYRLNGGLWYDTLSDNELLAFIYFHNGTNTVEINATDTWNNSASVNRTFHSETRPEPDRSIYDDDIVCRTRQVLSEDVEVEYCWIDESYSYNYKNLGDYMNYISTYDVYNGTNSLRFEGDTLDVIAMRSMYNLNVFKYDSLSFYVNGTPGSRIIAKARYSDGAEVFPNVSINLTGQWTHVQINMTQLNPDQLYFDTIQFSPGMIPGNMTNITFYLDDIRLDGMIVDNSTPVITLDYEDTVIDTTLLGGTSIMISGNVRDDTYLYEQLIYYRNNNTNYSNIEFYNMETDTILLTNQTYNWNITLDLGLGENLIEFVTWDESSRFTTKILNITLELVNDTTPPDINIEYPADGMQSNSTTIVFNGTTYDGENGTGINSVYYRINGGDWFSTIMSLPNLTEWYTDTILLSNGSNLLEVRSMDNNGNNITANVTVYYNYTNMNAIPLIIYEENNLTSNWSYEGYSSNVSVTMDSSEQVYSGSTDMKVVSQGWGTLNLMIGNESDTGVLAENYTFLRFAVYANDSLELIVKMGLINDTNTYYDHWEMLITSGSGWFGMDLPIGNYMNATDRFNSIGLIVNQSSDVTYYIDNVQIVP